MAKRKKQEPTKKKVGGPFLACAVFCQNVIEDSNRFVSALGINDGVTMAVSPQAPSDLASPSNPVAITQNALIIFRSGDSHGKHKLSLIVERPDGTRMKPMTQEIVLPKDAGVNVRSAIPLKIEGSGVFWIDVKLDGRLHTRMPLKIQVQRAEVPGADGKKS